MDNEKLNILHDHYKESFSLIREMEKRRDRFFILIIAITGGLLFGVQYSESIPSMIKFISIGFVNFDLSLTPYFVLISVGWLYLFVTILKYCQLVINIERKYKYIHLLEDKVSTIFKDSSVYCREGRGYLDNYPFFSDVVWIFYILLFPLIIIISLTFVLFFEWKADSIPPYHFVFDGILAFGIILLFLTQRFSPLIKRLFKKS